MATMVWKYLVFGAILIVIAHPSAATTSTIDPTIPQAEADLDANPIRNNFAAAKSDIDSLWAAVAGAGGLSLAPAHTVLAGPLSGSPATGAFRALVGDDLPLPSANTIGGVESLAPVTSSFVTGISTSGVPQRAQPAFSDLSGNINVSQMNGGSNASASTVWFGNGTWGSSSGVIWPASGNLVLSNGTNSPAALAPIDGECPIGSGGTWIVGACGMGGGSSAFSGLLAASGTNSINNGSFAQSWLWNGLTAQTGLAVSTNSLTSGTLFAVNVTSTAHATALSSTVTGAANTGYAGYFANAASTGYAGYFNGAVNVSGLLTNTQFFDSKGAATPVTILATDMGKNVTHSSSSAVAVTLPQAGTAGFASGASYTEINSGTGAVTITPTVSAINGAATLTLIQNNSAYILSDGTNYFAFLGTYLPPVVNGDCITAVGGNWVAGSCSGTPSTMLSSLVAAAGTNTFDNANFAQTWAWGTLSTQSALTLTSSSLSTGAILNVNTPSITDSGYGIYAKNESTTGYAMASDGRMLALNNTNTGVILLDPYDGGGGPKVHIADQNGHILDNNVFVGSTFNDLVSGDGAVAASSTLNLLGGGAAAIKFSYNNWTEAGRVVNSDGDFLIGTLTDSAKLTVGGQAFMNGLVSNGTKFTTSGCSVSTTTGGATAGKFTLGANSCSVVITFNGATGETASNGWSCRANDETAPTMLVSETANSTTTATLSIPAGAGATDVIDFACIGF